jgi:hypothetical protein
MPADEFQGDLVRHLLGRGLSDQTAQVIAKLLDSCLDFKVEPTGTADFDAYVCFAFGNEPDGMANLKPGVVNVRLAEMVAARHKAAPKPIIAQWEIGEVLKDRSMVPRSDVVSIGQSFDRVLGKPDYQSTRTFLKDVAAYFRSTNNKRLFVVAQWFHYARCVREVKLAGFTPILDQDAMPRDFCTSNFGQLWTSEESRHVLHTLIGSFNRHRESENEAWKKAQSPASRVLP